MTLKNDSRREAGLGLDPATEDNPHRGERGMEPERWAESERAAEEQERVAAQPEEERAWPREEGPLGDSLEQQYERIEDQAHTRFGPEKPR